MIRLDLFAGYPIAVLGLGKSGLSAARALQQGGAEVLAWDDDVAKRDAANDLGIPVVDLKERDWQELTTLVISPGIPHLHPAPHPVARLAREAGCEIICDVELLARAERNASYVGITGTNGKSTTTALIGHILETAGREVEVGGNLGRPVLDLAPLGDNGAYVLEMSSYQIELTLSITFDIAVLLNITPDHTERHGGFEGYVAAKRHIFHRQTRPKVAVIGVDDPPCQEIFEDLRSAGAQIVIPISSQSHVEGGIYVDSGVLYDDMDGQRTMAVDLREIPSLPGLHNWQNAAAAYATAKSLGVEMPVIAACIQSFPGLAHRQELVAVIDGLTYVNDSKATNADATGKALACYETIYWIAGGRAKEGGLSGLEPYFKSVIHVFLIGEAEETFAEYLAGRVPAKRCGTLAKAVAAARETALADGRGGAVILLSPACASFDQFANFEARGDAFRALVDALPGRHVDLGPAGAVLQ